MRAKTVNERINFERGQDPKKSLRIGDEYFKQKLEEIKNKSGYTNEEDFEDDQLIIYAFNDIYEKWKKSQNRCSPEDIKIWDDKTSGGTNIIKIKGPGIRETTVLRWELYSSLFGPAVLKLMNSPEMKQEIADGVNADLASPAELANKIFSTGERRGLNWGAWSYAETIAKRLIKLLG